MRRRQFGRIVAACSALALLLVPAIVEAQCANGQSCSSQYNVNEVYFGPGGNLNSTSTNFGANSTVGDTAVGRTGTAIAGGQTDRQESLEFVVPSTSADLGVLNTSSAATTSMVFSVKSYLASGYVITTASDPPKTTGTGSYTLANLTTPTASSPGTEQFGINLAANTNPSVGGSAAPTQSPDSTFGSGVASTGYNTSNLFKYVKGDAIANSPKSSGTTNYTISYLYNISNLTRAGQYNFNLVLVATSTF